MGTTPSPLRVLPALLLGLSLACGPVLAQSADGPGRGQGVSQGASQGKGHGKGNRGEERRHDTGERRFDRDEGPRFDEHELRRLFQERREEISVDRRDSLPPGILKNLERGKPLPPGIAKRFDDRLLRDLPRHDDYEWRHVGTHAVLVDTTNDIIQRVLRDVLR